MRSAITARLGHLSNKPGMLALATQVTALGANRYAASTITQYDRAWQRYVAFCRIRNAEPLQTNGAFVACYLASLINEADAKEVGPGGVLHGSAAVGERFRRAGLTDPTSDPLCANMRAAAESLLQPRPRDKSVFTRPDLEQLLNHHMPGGRHTALPLDRHMHLVCVALMFYGLLRYSDLARVLVHVDLLRIEPAAVDIFLYTDKTLLAARSLAGRWISLGGEDDSPFDPARLLSGLLTRGGYQRAPAQPDEEDGLDFGPLLRAASRTQLDQVTAPLAAPIPPLPYETFLKSFRRLAVEAGLPESMGLHAMRRGAASELVARGVEHTLVRKAGRWVSDEVFSNVYVVEAEAARRGITRHLIPS